MPFNERDSISLALKFRIRDLNSRIETATHQGTLAGRAKDVPLRNYWREVYKNLLHEKEHYQEILNDRFGEEYDG